MTEPPTLESAARAVLARKHADGLRPGDVARTDEHLALLAGTDLDHKTLEAWALTQGHHAAPAWEDVGPVLAGASLWREGLLVGVEYQRQRDEKLRRRNAALVGALETVRRRLLDLALELDHEAGIVGAVELRAVTRIVDTVLEADG